MSQNSLAYDFSGPFARAVLIPNPKSPDVRYPLWTLGADQQNPYDMYMLNGLHALAYVTEISVKQHLGLIPTMTVTFQPPFDAARLFLESQLVEWGHSVLEVTLGYSTGTPNGTVMQKYEALVLKPDITMGVDTSISFHAQGVGGFAASTFTSSKSWPDKSHLDVLTEVIQRTGMTLDTEFVKDDSDAMTLLKMKRPSHSQEGHSDWYYAQVLAKEAGCWGLEVNGKFKLVSKNAANGGKTGRLPWKFNLFDYPNGRISGTGADRVFPILSISTPTMAVFLSGAAKALRAMGTSSKSRKTVKAVVNDATSNIQSTDKKGVGRKDQQPKEGEETLAVIDVANDPQAKAGLQDLYSQARNGMGITLEIGTLGMPDLLPGDLIDVTGVAKSLIDGLYLVMELEHSFGSGGFSTKFKAVTNTGNFSDDAKAELAAKRAPQTKIRNLSNDSLSPKGGSMTIHSVGLS